MGMKQEDIIKIIDDLATRIAKHQPVLATPDMPGYRPMQITFMPQSKYKFSRAKWYVAEYDWVHYGEVIVWCAEQFGPHPHNPDAWSRWCNHYSERIHFRDQEDYIMFKLRWGT